MAINRGCFSNDLLLEELFRPGYAVFSGDPQTSQRLSGPESEGTILLDQIENMSPKTQLSMLKIIDSKKVSLEDGSDDFPGNVRELEHIIERAVILADGETIESKHLPGRLLNADPSPLDEAILKRLFKLYKIKNVPEDIMPMTISWLGNSSVATLPTLFDLLQRGNLKNQKLNPGDLAVFASVGAGMNINALVYRMH